MEEKLDVAPQAKEEGISPNMDYLRTAPALLKITEFILTLLAFSLTSSFVQGVAVFEKLSWGRADFFIFVMVVAWLGTIALFLFYFLNIVSKFKGGQYLFMALAFLHFSGALCILVSTCLVFDDCREVRNLLVNPNYKTLRLNLCDIISRRTSTSCGIYEFASVCGFFAFIAVAIDGVLHTMKGIQEYRLNAGGETTNEPEIDETPGSAI